MKRCYGRPTASQLTCLPSTPQELGITTGSFSITKEQIPAKDHLCPGLYMANGADVPLLQAPLHLKSRQKHLMFPLLVLIFLHPTFQQGPEGKVFFSLYYKDT